jgi:neutral ceramidase
MPKLSLALLLALALPGALVAQDGSRVFRAGAAASDITPPLGSPIVGGWTPTPATHVHDQLYARALVLDDGTTRVAIVVSDNLGMPRHVLDAAKRAIAEKTGLPAGNMLMSATHTHSSASARGKGGITEQPLDEYQRFLAGRIADAVLCAIHNLEPARIGWSAGQEPTQVFNRRWRMKPGTVLRNPFGGLDQVMMNPRRGDPNLLEPAGPIDPEINFVAVQSLSGRPIALLANYSLHYVGGTDAAAISADYFGVFSQRIGELLGAANQQPPFVGIMSNGASGDINNIDFRLGDPPKYRPYEKMRLVANLAAAEVYKACQTLQYRDWAPLGAAVREVPLAIRLPGAEDIRWAESVLKNPPGLHAREEVYARRTLGMRDHPAQIPFLVQALRIGDVGITAIPAEVFVEIGLEIRKSSPFPRTFTIGMANGSYGYLPTPEHHELGGYETWRGSSILEIEASRKITAALVEMLAGLR